MFRRAVRDTDKKRHISVDTSEIVYKGSNEDVAPMKASHVKKKKKKRRRNEGRTENIDKQVTHGKAGSDP